METFLIDNCPFKVIYVDLTTKCNMKCNFCYQDGVEKDDIDIDYFEEVCKRLPHKVIFRLLGGEPTLHSNFIEILNISRKYGHFPTVASNGKKYLDKEFVKELSKIAGVYYGITMNGGLHNRKAYKIIDNSDCLEWKIQALHNLLEAGIRTINLSAIIYRDLNYSTIQDFIKLAEKYRSQIKYLKLRSTSYIGAIDHVKTIDTQEFKNEIKPKYFKKECKTIYTSKENSQINICKKRECCHYFIYDKFLTVSYVEFGNKNSKRCWKRGTLGNDFTFTKHFEQMEFFGNKERK